MSAAEQILHSPSQGEAAQCVAFVTDNQTHGVVESVARQFFDSPIVRDGETQQALEYLSEFAPPKVIIVDIGESSAPLTALLSLTAAFTEDTRLIGIGTINDINLYREMIGAGITDYLVKPITEKALAAAFSRAEEGPASAAGPTADSQDEKVNRIAIMGSRGGVGASAIAVNMAWLISEQHKLRTALIDLDLEFGTVALSLDLEPTRGLREAMESPGRIDSLFIESTTAKITERLSVLATEETLSAEMHLNPGAADLLFDTLGRSHDCIIVDVPRSTFGVRRRIFELANKILVVTELNLPGLRDSMRLVSGIEEVAPNTPIMVIANRTGGAHQAMQPRDFQKALGHKIDFMLPEDQKAFNQAANSGKPLVQSQSRSKPAKSLQKVVDAVIEVPVAEDDDKGRGKKKKKRKSPSKSKKPWAGWFKKG